MRYLGLDLAYRKVGWVVMEPRRKFKRIPLKLIDKGIETVPKDPPMYDNLVYLYDVIRGLIKKYKPDVIVLEDTFLGKNADTAAKLNVSKGMAMACIYSSASREPVCATAQIVRTCLGLKSKEEVFNQYSRLYNIENNFNKYNDITDAIALCYYHYYNSNGLCYEVEKPKSSRKKRNVKRKK
jgi:crossover junction endodeoxyribonuclease RuvC